MTIKRESAFFDGITEDAEEQALQTCNRWVAEQQLPAGELAYNLTQSETNEILAILDLAWPDGLQPGYSQPVALLLDEDSETKAVASQSGFRFFTDVERFQTYVRKEILSLEEPTEEIDIPEKSLPENSIQTRPMAAV